MTSPTPFVKILIDNKHFESPEHTTGEALYKLGGIDHAKFDLFRETGAVAGDEHISYDQSPITVASGQRFFSVQKKLNPGSEL
jgi:hypothetical protein